MKTQIIQEEIKEKYLGNKEFLNNQNYILNNYNNNFIITNFLILKTKNELILFFLSLKNNGLSYFLGIYFTVLIYFLFRNFLVLILLFTVFNIEINNFFHPFLLPFIITIFVLIKLFVNSRKTKEITYKNLVDNFGVFSIFFNFILSILSFIISIFQILVINLGGFKNRYIFLKKKYKGNIFKYINEINLHIYENENYLIIKK